MSTEILRPERRGPLYITQRTREEIAGYLCILPWILGFLLFTAGPFVFSLYLSLHKANFLQKSVYIGLDNYRNLLGYKLWGVAIRNTAVYAFVSVPINVIMALMLAMLLNQKVRGLAFWRTIFYLPAVVQGVAVSLLWIWLFHPNYGPISGFLRTLGVRNPPLWIWSEEWAMPALIIMSTWGVGGSMIIYLAGLQGVSQSFYDAASIDGADVFQRFRHITLPMMTPTIFFSLIMGLIGAWQMFTQAFVMTNGGPNNATLTAVFLIYRKAFQEFYMGYASAMAWVLFVIILFFTLIVLRSSEAWVFYEGEIAK
jgi:multiple sugar transport system permease protein